MYFYFPAEYIQGIHDDISDEELEKIMAAEMRGEQYGQIIFHIPKRENKITKTYKIHHKQNFYTAIIFVFAVFGATN